MTDLVNEYEYFYSKQGFNKAASHFDAVVALLGDFQKNINLADRLNLLLSEKALEQAQVPALVNALLVDKLEYRTFSYNLENNLQLREDAEKEFLPWNAVDIVLVYNHPDLGYTVLNPKNRKHWEMISLFKKNELLTVYVGEFLKTKKDSKSYDLAINKSLDFFNGRDPKGTELLKKGTCRFVSIEPVEKPQRAAKGPRTASKKSAPARGGKAPRTQSGAGAAQAAAAPAQAQSVSPAPQRAEPEVSKNRRMTPFYSIPVTNELFHNGNVEAWKKIIQSYQTKHKGLEVYIYYDGERIHDIHSLFKWGKVKHGSTILFAVAGDEIKDVAKLQRYLMQGASPRFEDFLRFPVNQILNLF